MANWAMKQPTGIQPGETITDSNLCQLHPDTPVCFGIEKLTFVRCNLVNCRMPKDAVLIDCATAQIDWCAHLHPEMGLPAEPDECRHVVSSEAIYDGQTLLTTIDEREDIV